MSSPPLSRTSSAVAGPRRRRPRRARSRAPHRYMTPPACASCSARTGRDRRRPGDRAVRSGAPRVWWRLDSPQMLLSGWAVVFHGTAAWRNHGLIIFPLCFIEHLSNCAVQLPRLVAGCARQAASEGGHLLVGHPALRRGFPGLVKGDASASSPATPEAPLTWAGVPWHPSGGRRGLLPGPRAGTWPSVPSRQACSYSPGGRPPVRRMTRAVLYQLAHSLVAASTWAGSSHGPRWPVTSVLDRPMMLSASALS